MKKSGNPKNGKPEEKQQMLMARKTNSILRPFKSIRIAVTGDVPLTELEINIIDTIEFQRLRGIKELGTTNLVYPTAVHTRFDHSLGTLAMSMKMVRAIRENRHSTADESLITDTQEILIRLLALLHDITHIPFGHTLEDEFCIFPRHDQDTERLNRFLGPDTTIGKIIQSKLDHDMYIRFMKLYTANKNDLTPLGEDAFIYDLVNNTVCADLLDYLKRDCYFTYINLDTEYRFLRYLYLRQDGGLKRVVIRLWKEGKATPRRDILSELIRLLDNRYLLGERVYFHHAKLISGAMIAAAVQRAVVAKKLKKEDMYELKDDVLLERLNNSGIKSIIKLVSCLNERRLWKQIYEKDRSAMEAEQKHTRDQELMDRIMREWWLDPNSRQTQEDEVASLLGMDSGDFLIHCPDKKMAMKLAEMKVFWNGRIRPLRECEDDPIIGEKLKMILRSHENLWAIRCFINPEFLEQQEKVVIACNHLFNYDTDQKQRFMRLYYNSVIDEVASENGFDQLVALEYNQKKGIAMERLISDTAMTRNKDNVLLIIKDAFSS